MTQATATNIEGYLTARQHVARRQRLVQLACLLTAVSLVGLAGLLVPSLNQQRREHQLTLNPDTVKGLPWDIQLLTKTGTLRALAVDMAFMRMEALKQENRFYELMQLSDWLCKLAPHYASVWSYSAWNMAYNISVAQYTPDARWMWVNNGIRNLRNDGIRYNPKAITLYKELAWIYNHKIGDKLDDMHWQYKSELATEMERILGEPPLMASTEEAVDLIRSIHEAPDDVDAWLAGTNGASEMLAAMDTVELSADTSLLTFVAMHLRTYTDYGGLIKGERLEESFDRLESAKHLLRDSEHAPLARRLIAGLRKQILRDDYNMNPEWMLTLMEDPMWLRDKPDLPRSERLVPIDWRLPWAHSLYWSTYGDMVTRGKLNINEADSMNAVRFIFFSLKSLAQDGRLLLEPNFEKPNTSYIQTMPDSRFYHHLHAAYLHFGLLQFGTDPRFIPGTSGPNYRSGHHNFLLQAMRELYMEGGDQRIEEAKRYYAYLHKYDREQDGSLKVMYVQPFEKFVFKTIFDALQTQANANSMISESLQRSLHSLGNGDIKAHNHYLDLANQFWEYYMKDMKPDRNTRRKLQPLLVMRRDATKLFFQKPGFSPLEKSRVWRQLDLPTRKAVYDDIFRYVEAHCGRYAPPLDARRVIPEPPDMEEYRLNRDEVLEEMKRLDPMIEEGEKQTPAG